MSYPMLNSDLETLKKSPELQGRAFGISRIQRYMQIGYNRAAHLVDAAIELGVLTRDQDSDWLVRLTEQK